MAQDIDLDALPREPDLRGAVLLDRYRVLERLGKGGMGTVYLAEHTTIGKKFALKVLGSQHAHRLDQVQRFLQEARAASMINQQNVVEISDFGETPDGSVFFVMEYLDGEDLGATIKREKRLPWARIRPMMVQVCRALEAAHAQGIVHRDMKPDNCFRITRGGDPDFIKVLDFGIAKVQGGEGEAGRGLTQTGMVFGTPEYMAPEQAEGAATDHRVDVYAVGVIMYELLCGRVPFTGTSFMGILTKHLFEVPEAPSAVAPAAEIPAEAEAVVLKAMQKDPNLRFADMAELIGAIEAVGTGAGPVEVVAETIKRPGGGATQFAGRPATQSGTQTGGQLGQTSAAQLQPPEQAQAGGRKGLWIAGAGLLAAAGIVGALAIAGVFSGDRGGDRGGEQQQAEAAEPPAEAAPPEPAVVAAPPAEPEPAPAATRIELHLETNVPAQILDARDRAIYGSTEDEEGLEFEESDEPVNLILAAEGYEDLAIEVVPNRDGERLEFELIKLRKTGKRKRKRKHSKPASKPAPKPPPKPEPAPPRGRPDGDLKNPFKR